MKNRREFLKCCFVNTTMAFLYSPIKIFSSVKRPPNVLLIVTDDQGFGDITSHGNLRLDTPTMDRLASEGARFDRFFVSPVCAPTRASLLTGRYHLQTGTRWVTRNLESMRSEEVTIAEILYRNGYKTGCFGKWHNGAHYPEHPNAQGFDEFFGFCGGVTQNYFDPELEYNGNTVKTQGFISDVLTKKAIDFMRENRSNPFFCYLPYNAPHTPCQVPDKYFDKYKDRGFDNILATIYGMIENLDDNLSRLLQSLLEMDLDKETIVIFMTDNGPNGWRFNAGMKGKKGNIDEGGVRVPLFVKWPGIIEPGLVIKENAAHIDLLPTITDLCEIPIGQTLPLEGKSLKPLLEGRNQQWQDRILFTFPTVIDNSDQLLPGAARTQRWRAIKKRGNWELYDIQSDPGQIRNVAEQNSWVLDKLSLEYENKYKAVLKNIEETIPIQIGHIESPVVTLPGHEATLHPAAKSGISYHFHPGYTGSWITQWTNIDAFPEWYLKIVKEAEYQIDIQYVCEAENVGVDLQIEVAGKKLPISISEAYDPPPITVPFRIEAEEYKYMTKIWKDLNCGRVFLQKGLSNISVKTVKIPGKKSIDLKSVKIKLLSLK